MHPHPAGSVQACTWRLWVSSHVFPEDACLLPVAIPISKMLGGSLSLLPACRLLAPLVYSRNRPSPGSSLAVLALQPRPCGKGSCLTFSLQSSKPSHRTVMTFSLQGHLWTPAHAYCARLITRCGWHRCPARTWGLGWPCQFLLFLVASNVCSQLWRNPHQPEVGPHSGPLL